MKDLVSYIKKLSRDETKYFYKIFENHQKKKDCLDLILSKKVDNDYELCEQLGYNDNKQAFHTLKHRITESLLSKRNVYSSKSKTDDLEEKTFQLRNLLYSNENKLISNKIKNLKKRALLLENYKCLAEITFCEYMLYYSDVKKRNKISVEHLNYVEKERLYKHAELEFYKIIFEYQDAFYDPGHKRIDVEKILQNLREYYANLHSDFVEFFLLSAELTFYLNSNYYDKGLAHIKVNRLSEIYNQEKIRNRFPDCDFAIECLFNKFYLNNNDDEAFLESVEKLDKMVSRIKGVVMYENVYVYYIYAKFNQYLINGNEHKLSSFLNKEFDNFKDDGFANKYLAYFYYYQAIVFYYQKDYKNAEKSIMLSRNYKNLLDDHSLWILVDNTILNILINLENKSNVFFNYEIQTLKKLLSKSMIKGHFKNFIKNAIRYSNNMNEKNFEELINSLEELKSKNTGRFIILKTQISKKNT